MEHIAIDLGGRESQICVRGPEGAIIEESRHPTARLACYLKRRPPSRVILETSAEAFKVADQAIQLGHDVRVVPATLVPSLGVGSRGVKTDRRDAQILSEVSSRIDLPSVHIPSEVSQRTSITKAGPPRVRWALGQAARILRITRKNDPLVLWAEQVEKRRGRNIAMTALARRIAGVLYAIWRDGTRYDPSRLRA
jgi:hypothetical protein